jgi:hypothetical protein
VNGLRLAGTALLGADSRGNPPAHVSFGTHRVRRGEIWLFTPKLVTLNVSGGVSQATLNTSAIVRGLGRTGTMMPGGVYRVALPRSDLHVTLDGVSVKTGFALGGYAVFKAGPQGTLVLGDVPIRESEVAAFQRTLESLGFQVTALHNHLLRESPHVLYLHYMKVGDAGDLASGLKKALAATKMQTAPSGRAAPSAFRGQVVIERQLGRKGTVSSGVLSLSVPRAPSNRILKYVLQWCSVHFPSSSWIILVMTSGAQEGAVRIRVWRALKGLGAGVLRDGIYLLPARPHLEAALREQRAAIEESGGAAFVLPVPALEPEDETALRALFDRGDEYAGFLASVRSWLGTTEERTELEGRRGLRQLKRDFESIVSIDFFAGTAQAEARAALLAAEATFTRKFAPEEPVAVGKPIAQLEVSEFRGRLWATRKRLWADRVASAWLIRRFIDPDARFLWLENPKDCPADAIGFDFDGAAFTHVGDRVTFEVLIESFGLNANAALARLGMLIRALDTGSVNVAESVGFEAILTGARERFADDDALLSEVTEILNCLYITYTSDKERLRPPWPTTDRPSGKSTVTS